MKPLLAVFLLLAAGAWAYAADVTWQGDNSANWNTTTNWDTGAVPTAADRAIIPVVVGTNVYPIISVAPTNTIDQLQVQAGATLTINDTLTLNIDGGTTPHIDGTGTVVTGGTGKIAIVGGATNTIMINNSMTLGNLTIAAVDNNDYQLADGITVTMNGNLVITTGDVEFGSAAAAAVTLDLNGDLDMSNGNDDLLLNLVANCVIKISGNWTLVSTCVFNAGTNSTIEFDGAGDQFIDFENATIASIDFEHFKVNKAGGTLTYRENSLLTLGFEVDENFIVGQNMTVVIMEGATSVTNAAGDLFEIGSGSTVTFEQEFDMGGDISFNVDGGADNGILILKGAVIDFGNSFTGGLGTVKYSGTGAQTVRAGSAGYYNLTIDNTGAGLATQEASPIDVDNDFTIVADGEFTAADTITIGRHFTNNGTFTHGSQIVTFDTAAVTSNISGSSSTTFSTLNLGTTLGAATSKTINIGHTTAGSALTTTATTLNVGSTSQTTGTTTVNLGNNGTADNTVAQTLTVTGSVTINVGTTGGGALVVTAAGSLNHLINAGANWTNNKTFTANSGTVVFNAGAGTQVIGGSVGTTFNHLTHTTAAAITFGDTTTGGLTFTVSGTFTWSDGNLTVGKAAPGALSDTLRLTNATVANSSVTVGAGDTLALETASVLELMGNWNDSAGTFTPPTAGTSKVTMNGSNAQTITVAAANYFFNLTISNTHTNGVNAAGNLAVKNTLTVSSGGKYVHDGGTIDIGRSGTSGSISAAGTWQQSGGTVQKLAAAPAAGYGFQVTATGTFNATGGTIRDVNTTGVDMVDGATLTALSSVTFTSFAAGAAQYFSLTAGSLYRVCPGCSFELAAITNVKLRKGAAAGQPILTFESRSDVLNGAGRGETNDDDEDNGTPSGVADNGTIDGGETANGGIVQWVYTANTKLTGTIQGFPTAAIDLSTFVYYSTYAVMKDYSGGTDAIYILNADGDINTTYTAQSDGVTPAFTLVAGDGDIVGPIFWSTESGTHVVYFGTTTGNVYRLVDSGTTLTVTASWPFTDAVTPLAEVTSSVITDGTYAYFGGRRNATPTYGLWRVRISDRTMTQFSTAGVRVKGAPAWDDTPSGRMLYFASDLSGGNSNIYRVEASTWSAVNATYNGQATPPTPDFAPANSDCTADITAYVNIVFTTLYVGENNGYLHALPARASVANFVVPIGGYPFRDNDQAVKGAPRIHASSARVFFGNAVGDVYTLKAWGGTWTLNTNYYKLTPGGATAIETMPLYRVGVVTVSNTGGKVFSIDANGGSGGPAAVPALRTYTFGTSALSDPARDSTTGRIYVTSQELNGRLYAFDMPADPTPASP